MSNKYTYAKLFSLLFIVITLLLFTYNFFNEVNFQRFENIYAAFIDLILYYNIDHDYAPIYPLLDSNVAIDPSLPQNYQSLMLANSYCPSLNALILITHAVTSLPPQIIAIMSFGVIYGPIIYLALIKQFIPRTEDHFTLLLWLAGIFYLSHATKVFSGFYVAAIGFPMLFILIICLKKYCDNTNPLPYAFFILITVTSLALYWHTLHMMALFIIISLWFYFILASLLPRFNFKAFTQSDLTKGKRYLPRHTLIFTAVVVISLTLSHLWQNLYAKNLLSDFQISDTLSKISLKLSGKILYPIPYAFNYKDWFLGSVYFHISLVTLILAAFIFAIALLLYFTISRSKVKPSSNTPLTFCIVILSAQVICVATYYQTGNINPIYVPLFFPLLGMSLISDIFPKGLPAQIKAILVFILGIIVILGMFNTAITSYTYEMGHTSLTTYDDTKSSFEWVYSSIDMPTTIFMDFNIYGKYLQREIQTSQHYLHADYIRPDLYSLMVGDDLSIISDVFGDYVIVDHATMQRGLPIYSGTFQTRFLVPKYSEINNCDAQNKIYADNRLSVFTFHSNSTYASIQI